MFQKEVADRIIAKNNTKNYGRLSILSNWKMDVEKIIDIEPNSFKPAPKVKSTLLLFTPKKKFFELKDPKNLEHVTNIFFSQRRKMIKKPLKFLFKDFQNIARLLNLDIAGVDLLFNGESYTICEVNSAPGFKGMEKYTKINVAEQMVDFIMKKVGTK